MGCVQLTKNEENQQRFKFLGVLLGLAIVNQCTMDLNLPPLFFKVKHHTSLQLHLETLV